MAVKAKTKKQKDSVVEIEAEISADELEAHKKSIFFIKIFPPKFMFF